MHISKRLLARWWTVTNISRLPKAFNPFIGFDQKQTAAMGVGIWKTVEALANQYPELRKAINVEWQRYIADQGAYLRKNAQ